MVTLTALPMFGMRLTHLNLAVAGILKFSAGFSTRFGQGSWILFQTRCVSIGTGRVRRSSPRPPGRWVLAAYSATHRPAGDVFATGVTRDKGSYYGTCTSIPIQPDVVPEIAAPAWASTAPIRSCGGDFCASRFHRHRQRHA